MQDDYENFVCFASCNEIFRCNECIHISIVGQMALFPFASSLGCKSSYVPPLCVINCSGQIYYVVHRLKSISRIVIHLGVHKHLVANGKCREFEDETRG